MEFVKGERVEWVHTDKTWYGTVTRHSIPGNQYVEVWEDSAPHSGYIEKKVLRPTERPHPRNLLRVR